MRALIRLARALGAGPARPAFPSTFRHYPQLLQGQWRHLPYSYNGQKRIKMHHPDLWELSDIYVIHYGGFASRSILASACLLAEEQEGDGKGAGVVLLSTMHVMQQPTVPAPATWLSLELSHDVRCPTPHTSPPPQWTRSHGRTATARRT